MDKKFQNKERIEKIKEEREKILFEVRESIKNGNKEVIEKAKEIMMVLDYDEKNIRKYNALKKAQELIENLTIELLNAKTPDDIVQLRKKINYYILKILKEAQNRNIDITKYYEKVSVFRKDISKYIRFLKKTQKIEAIASVNDNYDLLTDEEKKGLLHQISNERDYNTRYLNKKDDVKVKLANNPQNTTNKVVRNNNEISNDKVLFKSPNGFNFNNKSVNNAIKTFATDYDYVSAKVNEFDNVYNIKNITEYNDSLGHNLKSFIANIPVCISNRKHLKKMAMDYYCFNRNSIFGVYMEYKKRKNSIKEGFKGIFRKSSLYNNENIYIDNHEKCVEWILEFVRDNDINLKYIKAI